MGRGHTVRRRDEVPQWSRAPTAMLRRATSIILTSSVTCHSGSMRGPACASHAALHTGRLARRKNGLECSSRLSLCGSARLSAPTDLERGECAILECEVGGSQGQPRLRAKGSPCWRDQTTRSRMWCKASLTAALGLRLSGRLAYLPNYF